MTQPPSPTPTPFPQPPPPLSPAAPQAGILNRPPEHAIVAAFTLVGDASAVTTTLSSLRDIQRQELASQLPTENASTPKKASGPETGELGFASGFDRAHLTITAGFSSSAFDKLGVASADRPQDLVPIPWAKLGDTPAQPDEGDIVLQVCSDDPYVCEHVIHRVVYELAGRLILLWAQFGIQRFSSRQGRTSRAEGRALNGFIDGTSNLDPAGCGSSDSSLVFVDPAGCASYPPLPPPSPAPAYGQPTPAEFPGDLRPPPASEPVWTKHGSYMVVRSSLLNFESWDPATLDAQEKTIGRFKFSGAFLDLADDQAQLTSAPAFAANQESTVVPLTAHARKANPRGSVIDEQRRIFRRGYPLVAGSTAGLDRGLLFIAFGRTISTQFEFIFRAWMRNPNFPAPNTGVDALFSFEKQVLCGGYYFVPALSDPCDPGSWVLPAA